ncbi:MAG: hypothetical protein PUF97_01035 [Bifidobacteriaceae bacterium]|nr:hypothetical protein [Bifidobacteriaceae bacterium]
MLLLSSLDESVLITPATSPAALPWPAVTSAQIARLCGLSRDYVRPARRAAWLQSIDRATLYGVTWWDACGLVAASHDRWGLTWTCIPAGDPLSPAAAALLHACLRCK